MMVLLVMEALVGDSPHNNDKQGRPAIKFMKI